VATYVSVVGTGENVTGATMTGMAWGGAAGGGAALQPANRTAMAAQASEGRTRRVFVITDTVFLLNDSANACDFGALPVNKLKRG
jgi:hypothetical protein